MKPNSKYIYLKVSILEMVNVDSMCKESIVSRLSNPLGIF